MSDFETRLRETLVRVGDAAPAPVDLTGGARRRLRRRRLRWGAAVGALAVAAVAVPVAALQNGRGDGAPDQPVASDTTSAEHSPWRTETWRDLTFEVPADWGYGLGPGDSSCAESADDPPAVARPGERSTLVGCGTDAGYGVLFFDPGQTPMSRDHPPGVIWQLDPGDGYPYPDGAWMTRVETDTGSAAAQVVVPDRATAQHLVDSAHRVDVDPHGCWTNAELRDTNGAVQAPSSRLSVCRYAADGWLERSERLSAADTASALAAVSNAPLADSSEPCPATPQRYPEVVLTQGSGLGSITVVWEAGCEAENGVFLSGVRRELTGDVLYWAIPPGWTGAVPTQLRMPLASRR